MRTIEPEVMGQDKWVRSKDGILSGVCQGLGESFGVAPWVLRIIWLLSVLYLGIGLLFYIGLAIGLPKKGEPIPQKRILGVCYKIHKKLNMEVGLVRFLCLLLAVFSLGATLIGYIILYFIFEENGK